MKKKSASYDYESSIFMQMPAIICILRGPYHIYEFANEGYRQIVGYRDIIGKPIREALPELQGQGFYEIMDDVYKTGEPFIGKEMPVKINKGNGKEEVYLNFIYQPLWDKNGQIDGILVHAVDVSEQVLSRQKIEENENRYHNLIHSSPSMIAILSGENLIIEIANDAILESWGKGKDVFGQSILTVMPEFIVQGVGDLLRRVFATGKPYFAYEMPLEIMRKGKKESGFYNLIYQAQRDKKGKIEGVAIIAGEVTPQAEFNKKIRYNEQRFRSVVAQSPGPVMILKGENMVVEIANEPAFKAFNIGEKDIGKPFFEILPDLDNQGFLKIFRDVYFNDRVIKGHETPAKVTLEDGSIKTRYFNFVYQPYRETDGTKTGVLVIATNVTKQVLATKKIEESEDRFRLLAETLPQLVWMTDEKGNSEFASHKWKEYSGIEPKGEKEWNAIVHPDDLERINKVWEHCLITGSIYNSEVRIKSRTGEYRWHSVMGEPVFDNENKIIKWVGAFTDIDMAKKEQQRKDAFISMASHELKTPVTTIKAYSQIAELILEEKGDEQTAAILKRMNNQVNKLTAVITSLLDSIKIEKGGLHYKESFYDFSEMVHEVVDDMQKITSQHTIKLNSGSDVQIFGDKDKIGQVINNLLSNAIKYASDTSEIIVNFEKQNDGVQLSVKDFGIGISEEDQQHVFEQFFRVDGESQSTFPGMGIGLYICAEIIAKQGGKIWIESELGNGAVFSFWLPSDYRKNMQ